MQTDNIIDKARRLGLDTGSSSSSADNLRTIASQVGLNDFNSITDVDKLESILDQKLREQNNNENVSSGEMNDSNEGTPIRNNSFGQKEYDQAKKDGVYDPNHYKAKQQELDKKADDLNQERQKNWKMKNGESGPVKADGSNTARKSKMDRVMDNLNYAKAKKDAISNKIDSAKSSAYNATHPLEYAKDAAKAKAKTMTKQVGKQAAASGKAAASALGKKIIAFIAANPWVLAVVGGVLLVVFIIFSAASSSKKYGHFDESCDYNLTTVKLTICDSEDNKVKKVSLKDYVIGVTNELTKDGDYSDSALEAIMIIVKTNALAIGNYDSDTKVVNLDTCTYNYEKPTTNYSKLGKLYANIENYLFLPTRFNDVITTLTRRQAITLNQNALDKIHESQDGSLVSILSSIKSISSSVNKDSKNIFIGDSRMHGMEIAGVISDDNSVYADGKGYNWFVNTAIAEANSKMDDSGDYNIFIWLGINDFSSSYVDAYANLAEGDWSKNTIYVMSVGPVDESKTSITNSQIDDFNDDLANKISNKALANLIYFDIDYDIESFDSAGIHYSNADYQKIYDSMFDGSSGSGSYQLYNLASYCEFIETDEIDNMNSNCSTSTDEANLVTFIGNFEGITGYCDDGNGYTATNIGDGTVTIGPGVTNHLLGTSSVASYIDTNGWGSYFSKSGSSYRVNVGDCVPTTVIDKIKIYSIEEIYASPIDAAAAAHGISLTQFQRDAIISFNYNLGTGYTERLISAYATGSYEGLWEYMKEFYKPEKYAVALKKRRKAEFALFVTGDYTDGDLFYSRSIDDYDNYDSEDVMSRMPVCSMDQGDFAVPLSFDSGFVCTSPFGYRIHPIYNVSRLHSGIDLGVAQGTPVLASRSGVVEYVLNNVTGSSPSSGNMVRIVHDDGMKTDYYHMKYQSVVVSVGDEVEQGQMIGEVGSTGASTGPHLHFTIYDSSGNLVDPYEYIDLSPLGDVSNCHN